MAILMPYFEPQLECKDMLSKTVKFLSFRTWLGLPCTLYGGTRPF